MSNSAATGLTLEQRLARMAQGLDPNVQTRDVGSPVAPVGGGTMCRDAPRVVLAGGEVVSRLLAKSFTPFERRYRKVVPAAVYSDDVSADSPVFFELGSFALDTSMALFVADYKFQAYRVGPSNSDPIPLEPERLSTSLGYTLGGRSMMRLNAQLQLVPTPVQEQQQQVLNQNSLQIPFSPLPSFDLAASFGMGLTGPTGPAGSFPGYPENPTVFNQASGVVQSPSSGSPVLPQSQLRIGARDMPFALYFSSSDTVQLGAVAYSKITTPLVYVEGVVSGFLVNSNTLESLLNGVRPCT